LLTAAVGSTDVVVVLEAPADATLEAVVVGPAPGFAATVVVVDDAVPATVVVEDAPAAAEVELPAIDEAVPATLVVEPAVAAVVDELLAAVVVGADDPLVTVELETATSDDGTADDAGAADELGAAGALGAADDAGAAAIDDGAWVSAAGAGVSAARAGAAAMVAVATREEMVRMVLRDMSSMIGVLSTELR
jgi:hypothetical protein